MTEPQRRNSPLDPQPPKPARLSPSLPPRGRRVYVNRTLNLRAIAAVGFDMDYTLVHYHVEEWERRAYEHARERLGKLGLPVDGLEYRHDAFTLGLVVDKELGNVVKANRFGFVKRAAHGTRFLDFDEQRRVYSRSLVDLAEPRWEFMNTLFTLSEACLYAQLVDRLDAGHFPSGVGYRELYAQVRASLDAAHVEGALKREIVASPDRFVMLDEELPLALLDLKHAGKKLLLVTNSEWEYAGAMMSHAFDRFLPAGGWRRLFDLVVVSARKPDFFRSAAPIFQVEEASGLLRPWPSELSSDGVYFGGNARQVERLLGCPGEDILYVGDHVFADVQVTKHVLRWRTALVLRELEPEIAALEDFGAGQVELDALMAEKERIEHAANQERLLLQRLDAGYGPKGAEAPGKIHARLQAHRAALRALDERIAPLSGRASSVGNASWGPLLRAGNDKSHLARQIERHADVYTSRVSNLAYATPFAYLRSPRGSLPHDPGDAATTSRGASGNLGGHDVD